MHRTLTRWRGIPAALLGAAALIAATGAARAEDIDIYVANVPTGDRPNVLFVLDNSANWSAALPVGACTYNDNGASMGFGPPLAEQAKKAGIEKCALHNVIDALPVADDGSALFNVGLMLFNESPAANSGGYPRIAITPVDKSTKAELKKRIRAVGMDSDKGNNAAFAKSLHEAFLYFSGAEPYVGNKGGKFDPAAFSGGRYASPAASSCSRNYLIFIGNGGPGEVTDNEARALLAGLGGNTTRIEYPTSYVRNSDQGNWADEYARFMSGQDVSSKDGQQTITTYTIAVTGASSDGLFPNFLRGMAQYGGGKFYEARNAEQLTQSILEIFVELADVNSAFVSASLPVSVNSRGTYLNQIFMGLFRPDRNAAPRWRGNLKQFMFSYDPVTDSLQLSDRNGNPAISPATGFFTPGAESFWSASSEFWVNEPAGTPPSISDLPDGEVVEKGGAAQRLRVNFASSLEDRKVFTCLSCASGSSLGATSATRFDRSNAGLTAAALNVGAADRDALIDWVRGVDNAGDEKGPGGTTVVRPSIHGDVLHSRPVVVNYGGSIGVVAFYGANDGMLHAINGNQAGAGAGDSYWSFVAEESLPRLNRLRTNEPAIRFSTTPDALTAPKPRDYFFDGPLSFYQKIAADGSSEKVYLYAGMRRGGRALYAFDVTNPAAPKFLWKRTGADIAVLGQTWSEARVARLKGHENPVLVMGAGYDPVAEDVEPAGAATMGKAVLVLDAINGTLLKTFATNRPVVADVSLVDSDYDGYIDRGYAADLGGKVYRIDFESASGTDSSNWAMTLFADLGQTASRKIFYPPDVVLTRDYAVVLIGTGDREKPLDNTTAERFFTLIDRQTAKGMPVGFVPISELELVTQGAFTSPTTQRGCYIAMDPAGEKIVNSPVTAGGTTYFSTNRPTPPSGNSCTGNLGEAKVYGVPLVCQAPKSQVLVGGGLPPSPVTGNVAITLGYAPDGTPIVRRVPFIIGGFNTKKSGIEGSKVQLAVPPRRSKLYWYPETER